MTHEQLQQAMEAEHTALTNRAKTHAILIASNRGHDEATIRKAVDAYDKARAACVATHNAVEAARKETKHVNAKRRRSGD